MWTRIRVWIRSNWLWVVPVALAVLYVGARLGWWFAALLGSGAAAGGTAAHLRKNQVQRRKEAERLAQERADIEKSARETDEMIQEYRRGRGDRR